MIAFVPAISIQNDQEQSMKAGPLDNIMPSGATPTQAPINGLPGLPGGGEQSSGQGQAKMIIGSFQAIVAPFDPSMMGNIAGAMGQLGQQNPPQMPNLG